MTSCILPPVQPLESTVFVTNRQRVKTLSPLVHCMTNDVVQEITANVLLSIGASPAMVVAKEESGTFAAISSALLINIGTPRNDILEAMHVAVDAANAHNVPWVLDPVAAGVIAWRDGVIRSFLDKHPTCVRGNASEIRALAGIGSGGKGVDSLDSSESALEAAVKLAKDHHTLVCVTGESDFATDGERILSINGGSKKATIVVGTGCSLSAMVAAYLAKAEDPLSAVASACAHAKVAQEKALEAASGPGSFKVAYIDALHNL
ncbi:MAG: hydroxyethylthiazole kinase [Duodenibacillus sp.]